MTNSPETYVHQQLAAAGFVFVDHRIAAEQRPDMFPNGMTAAGLFAEASQHNKFSDSHFYGPLLRRLAMIEGRPDPVVLLARCLDRLPERVLEVTGYTVTELRPMKAAETPAETAELQRQQNVSIAERARQAQIDKLRALADQELPDHECVQRKEILNARRQLAGMGAEISGFVPA